MSGEIPICADCKHIVGVRSDRAAARTWKCAHPSNVAAEGKDPVSGVTTYTYHTATCYDTRAASGPCQQAGILFESYSHPAPAPVSKRAAALPSADDLLGELGQ